MEKEKIDIFVEIKDGKKYVIEVPKTINCGVLMELLKEKIAEFHSYYLAIVYQGKEYKYGNKDYTFNFNQGDKIYARDTFIKECCTFHRNKDVIEKDKSIVELTGILQTCLLKFISKIMSDNEIDKISSNNIKNVLKELKLEMDLTDDPEKDIKENLSQKNGKNIIAYINYITYIAREQEIKDLIGMLDQNRKKEVNNYWAQLSRYEGFNRLFQKTFKEAIENSYFDYSLIDVSIYQQEKREKYINDLNNCRNSEEKVLFHGTQIDPIAKIITKGFLYTRKAFYGMGIYLSDMLDYISFYSGGKTYEDRRKNFGKTISVGETFSCVGANIFYDRDRLKKVFDFQYLVPELDHFPTYEELLEKYRDKMVEKNGIHFARVEPECGKVIPMEETINKEKKKGRFIGNEYVITEKEQILPLYGLTLKRNEYFVIWRDPNFSGQNKYTDFLYNAKMILYKNAIINFYIESSTEKAIELILRKRFNKIILISSVGLDLSGKKFVEIARKILGFDAVALFFSSNYNHLSWIQNFPNALYTTSLNICEKYVQNYNRQGLLDLKQEIEGAFNIKLKFTKNFLDFPKFVNHENYNDLTFEEVCQYFKKVIIKNKNSQKVLIMNPEGTVKFISSQGIKYDSVTTWYITNINGELTLFSNNFYLDYDQKNNKVAGFPYMKRWKYEIEQDNFYIYYENTNYTLTISGENAIIRNLAKSNDQIFSLIEENIE